jgi:hypothetical protein
LGLEDLGFHVFAEAVEGSDVTRDGSLCAHRGVTVSDEFDDLALGRLSALC